MKLRLVVACLVPAMLVAAGPAKADIHVTPLLGMIQPMVRSDGTHEVLLGDVSFCVLRFHRFMALGPGIGFATAFPVGGLTLSLSLVNYRVASMGNGEPNLYLGAKLIRDTHTNFNGVAVGFSLNW